MVTNRAMRRLLAVLSLLTLLLAACGDDGNGADSDAGLPGEDDAALPEGPEPDGGEDVQDDALAAPLVPCAHPEARYRIDYPENWHVNDPESAAPCSVFSESPVELTDGGDEAAAAVIVRIEPLALEQARQGNGQWEVLSEVPNQVAGRQAIMIDARATAENTVFQPGTNAYWYIVELGPQQVLTATTHGEGEGQFRTRRRVLDAMMATLEMDGDTAPASPSPDASATGDGG